MDQTELVDEVVVPEPVWRPMSRAFQQAAQHDLLRLMAAESKRERRRRRNLVLRSSSRVDRLLVADYFVTWDRLTSGG